MHKTSASFCERKLLGFNGCGVPYSKLFLPSYLLIRLLVSLQLNLWCSKALLSEECSEGLCS